MKTATYIRDLDGWTGVAKLFKVNPPVECEPFLDTQEGDIKQTEYIIVSATVVPFSGPEVLIFPAFKSGEPICMLEIYGQRQTLDGNEVLSQIVDQIIYD